MTGRQVWRAVAGSMLTAVILAAPSARADIRLVARPIEPIEQAFVEALRADLADRGLPVTDGASPGGPAPLGTLEVEFERADHSTAVWLKWSAGSPARLTPGWTTRLDALADAGADAKAALDGLDTAAISKPPAAAEVIGQVQVPRPPPAGLRASLTYNPLWAAAAWHQLDLELRWAGHAALVEGLIFSGGPVDPDDPGASDSWPGALERHSGWGLQLGYRYYGNPLAGWFLYAASRLVSAEADFDLGGVATAHREALNATFYLGVGGRWASDLGPTFGVRGGVPVYELGDNLDILGSGSKLIAAFDLELSLGWAF